MAEAIRTGPVLVTGATGKVGSDVVRALVAAGIPARAAVRDPARSAAHLGPQVEPVRFDFTDGRTWAGAVDGVTRMFLLRAPQAGSVRRHLLPFVDVARAAGVTSVAFLSVQGADRNPLLPHAAVERHLRRTGMGWTFLRAAYFFQNLSTVHRQEIRDRGEIFVPAGSGRTAFVDTRDVAEVAVRALSEPGHERQAYELTGLQALTYGEVAAVLSDVLGRPVRYPEPGALDYARDQVRRGAPLPFVLVTLALYTTARIGRAAHLSLDLQRLLGRRPLDLRRFAADYVDVWRPEGDSGDPRSTTAG